MTRLKNVIKTFFVLIVSLMVLQTVQNHNLLEETIDMLTVEASSGYAYDGKKAVAAAKAHVEHDQNLYGSGSSEARKKCSNGWLCAEYVATYACEGGLPIKYLSASGSTFRSNLISSGYCTEYTVKVRTDGYIHKEDFSGIIAPGDIVFFKCPNYEDGKPYVHTVMFSGWGSNGLLNAYGHNGRNTGGAQYYHTCGYCGATISEARVFHFNENNSTGTTNQTPYGSFDGVSGGEGTVSISGWAVDVDDYSKNIAIHVYVGDSEGNMSGGPYAITANKSRPDVVKEYPSVQENCGFDSTIKVNERGTKTVYVYAIDAQDSSQNTLLGSKTVYIENIPFSIQFSQNSLNIKPDETVSFSCDFRGDGIHHLSYSFSDPSVAGMLGISNISWTEGTCNIEVKGIKTGTTPLKIYLMDSSDEILFSKSISVTVKQPVTGITLNKSTMDLNVGDSGKLTATILPANASNKSVTWNSSNTSVATVKDGTVTAKAAGETTITASAEDGSGKKATCVVNVELTGDTEAPKIKNIAVKDISSTGYTITCIVTDNVGIDQVVFPTWTHNKGQDDLEEDWLTNPTYAGKISGNTVTYRVNISDHNNESGLYYTHIYARDTSGNERGDLRTVIALNGKVFEPLKTVIYGNHKYEIYGIPENAEIKRNLSQWLGAKTYCESLGGSLAAFESAEEWEYLKSQLPSGIDGYWLGGTDELIEGNWKWITGENMNITDWAAGEPNNDKGVQHHLAVRMTDRLWVDAAINQTSFAYGFICEYDISESGDVDPVPSVTEEPVPSVTEEPVPSVTEEPAPSVTEEPQPTSAPEMKDDVTKVFDDVYNDWYIDYVQYVYDNNLMTGIKGTKHFAPNDNITKAQVAQVLYNMENQPTVNDKKAFTDLRDVYAAEWYANAVAWAYNTGVVTGDLNTKKFSPNANVTREQLALMLYRYADYKDYNIDQYSDLSGLKNAENVSNWAADGVKWAVGAGLISGIDKNGVKDLAPQGNANRAQVAAILKRFCEAYNN